MVRAPEHVLTDIAEDYADSYLRRVMANFTAEEIYGGKAIARIQVLLMRTLADRLEFLGYVINPDSGLLIRGITFPSEFQQAMLDANVAAAMKRRWQPQKSHRRLKVREAG